MQEKDKEIPLPNRPIEKSPQQTQTKLTHQQVYQDILLRAKELQKQKEKTHVKGKLIKIKHPHDKFAVSTQMSDTKDKSTGTEGDIQMFSQMTQSIDIQEGQEQKTQQKPTNTVSLQVIPETQKPYDQKLKSVQNFAHERAEPPAKYRQLQRTQEKVHFFKVNAIEKQTMDKLQEQLEKRKILEKQKEQFKEQNYQRQELSEKQQEKLPSLKKTLTTPQSLKQTKQNKLKAQQQIDNIQKHLQQLKEKHLIRTPEQIGKQSVQIPVKLQSMQERNSAPEKHIQGKTTPIHKLQVPSHIIRHHSEQEKAPLITGSKQFPASDGVISKQMHPYQQAAAALIQQAKFSPVRPRLIPVYQVQPQLSEHSKVQNAFKKVIPQSLPSSQKRPYVPFYYINASSQYKAEIANAPKNPFVETHLYGIRHPPYHLTPFHPHKRPLDKQDLEQHTQ